MKKEKGMTSDASLNNARWSALRTRLDAIILLLMKSTFSDGNGNIKITDAAPLLYSAGISPTEIAKFFGKSNATEVAPYLYKKKGKKTK